MDKYWVFVVPMYATTVLVLVGYLTYLFRRLRDTREETSDDAG